MPKWIFQKTSTDQQGVMLVKLGLKSRQLRSTRAAKNVYQTAPECSTSTCGHPRMQWMKFAWKLLMCHWSVHAKGPSIKDVGNFFAVFDTPLPHVGILTLIYLLPSNILQHRNLRPTPPKIFRRLLWMAPSVFVCALYSFVFYGASSSTLRPFSLPFSWCFTLCFTLYFTPPLV